MRNLKPGNRTGRRAGQSIVEFALALPFLAVLLMGISETGFMFYAYVQVSNAAREGARAGTTYLYRSEYTVAQNDENRGWGSGVDSANSYANNVASAVARSLGNLAVSSTTFNAGSYSSGTTEGTADLKITYPDALDSTNNPSRGGQAIQVEITYHYRLPVFSTMLSIPAVVNLKATTTMMVAGR